MVRESKVGQKKQTVGNGHTTRGGGSNNPGSQKKLRKSMAYESRDKAGLLKSHWVDTCLAEITKKKE